MINKLFEIKNSVFYQMYLDIQKTIVVIPPENVKLVYAATKSFLCFLGCCSEN